MRIAYFCFIAAALAGVTGISLGIYMGVNQDFTLAPAHAHMNLLGWVTMALYGLYHRSVDRGETLLAWIQVLCGGLGFPAFAIGLAVYLGGNHSGFFFAAALAGSIMCLISIIMFLLIVILDALDVGRQSQIAPPDRIFGW